MESRPLRGLLLFVLAATMLAPSLGEVAVSRRSLGKTSENIVRGEQTVVGRHPYACFIRGAGSHDCTGFLVHPKIIITAAHCYESGVSFTFHCGGWARKGDDETHTYTGVFVAHKDYKPPSFVNDVAVITLDQESDITLPTVSRDIHEIRNWRSVCAMGWGRISGMTGPVSEVLKIAKDIKETAICKYGIEVICAYSPSGSVAPGKQKSSIESFELSCDLGDSGGPVIHEGDSAETDLVFGIVSGVRKDFSLTYFTNLPYYLESFVSEKVRAAEETIEAKLPRPKCPAYPTRHPSGNIQIEVGYTSVTFKCENSNQGEEASIEWNRVTRNGAEVRFDINIDDFAARTDRDSGFKLTVRQWVALHIHADGKSADWILGGAYNVKSLILPGSGTHKARIKQTAIGFEIYEDGMKSAVAEFVSVPPARIATRFSLIAEDASMVFSVSITNLRMSPDPNRTSNEYDSTEGGYVGGDWQSALTVVY